jgi:hypothetical protein
MARRDNHDAGVRIACGPGGNEQGKELAAGIQHDAGIPVDLQVEQPGAPLGVGTIAITVLTSALTNVATELVMSAVRRWLASRRKERGDLHIQLDIRQTKRSRGRRFLLKAGDAKTQAKLEAAQRYILEIVAPRAPKTK